MELLSDRILLNTAAENGLEVIIGYIGSVYLNDKAQENIYTHKGPKFELVDIMSNGDLLEVIKALYAFPNIGNRFHANLSHILRGMIFKPTPSDPDVWIRGREGNYDSSLPIPMVSYY